MQNQRAAGPWPQPCSRPVPGARLRRQGCGHSPPWHWCPAPGDRSSFGCRGSSASVSPRLSRGTAARLALKATPAPLRDSGLQLQWPGATLWVDMLRPQGPPWGILPSPGDTTGTRILRPPPRAALSVPDGPRANVHPSPAWPLAPPDKVARHGLCPSQAQAGVGWDALPLPSGQQGPRRLPRRARFPWERLEVVTRDSSS